MSLVSVVLAEFIVRGTGRVVIHAVFLFAERAIGGVDGEVGVGGRVGVDQQGRVAGDGGRPVNRAVGDARVGARIDDQQRAQDPRSFDHQFVAAAVDPVDALGVRRRTGERVDARAE